jgi:hypothetical protein
MRIEKEKMLLPCELTDDQKIKYGVDMATEWDRVSEAEGKKQAFNSAIKAEIEEHESRAKAIGIKLTSGKEYRDIECVIKRNWEEKARVWIRTDTLEAVKQDIIPEFELQEELALNDKKNQKEQADAVEAAEESKAFADPEAANDFEKAKAKKKGKK